MSFIISEEVMNRFLLPFALLLTVHLCSAQRTIPVNIEQLVRDAGMIVDAAVIRTETGKDPESGLLVTWVTLEVKENFYGASLSRITVKQYGGEADGIANYPTHLPRYTAGERSLLFLTAPSSIGMQSPVGMQQGKFLITEEGTAKKRIKNITMNPSLFSNLSRQSGMAKQLPSVRESDGSMDYEQFTALVRSTIKHIKQ
jgi:hypothetical protein